MISLTNGATTLELDPDLYWEDEYSWSATEQTIERSLTGAQIIHLGLRQAGRPITLRNEDSSSGWMARAAMATLQTWADTPGLQLTLSLRGTDYNVMFRHHDGGAFSVSPVVHYADAAASDWVLATLRFITV